MSFTLCTSGAVLADKGAGASSATTSGALLTSWSDLAEGRICAECHSDFITNWAAIPTSIQLAISDVCSAMIAMKAVKYDVRGYLTREADMLMNSLDDRVNKGLAVLKQKELQRFST